MVSPIQSMHPAHATILFGGTALAGVTALGVGVILGLAGGGVLPAGALATGILVTSSYISAPWRRL